MQKLRVCDVCGAFLSIFDSDRFISYFLRSPRCVALIPYLVNHRRLADHFGGKLHLGYLAIREKLTEMKEQQKDLPPQSIRDSDSREYRDREREYSDSRR